MPNTLVAGIILAAGKGTRMKSELPKCAHRVCGLPMVELIARAMKEAGVEKPIIVIGHGGEHIQKLLGDGYEYVWQLEQHGTGHAAMMALPVLEGFDGPVFISAGDIPLVDSHTFRELLSAQQESGATAVLATAILDDPFGYGRVIRNEKGHIAKSIEQKDATDEERKIREVNTGIYCVEADSLKRLLPTLNNTNAQGEYYLTDILEAIDKDGGSSQGVIFSDHAILMGINDRWQLALAEKELRTRILKKHALNGVTIRDIDSIVIGPDVEIGTDATIEPNTFLLGTTKVGARSHIGPCTRLLDTTVGEDTTITMSYTDSATVGNDVWVGPFAHLRPKSKLGDRAKIGNFVELKNTTMGEGAKASHLTYLGDATIGADTNIGAGTITCNFDGYDKHQTTVGANVFIGSHSTLVAPLTIGDGGFTAAGSVITREVPADAAAFGRARQETKPEWAAQWRNSKLASRSKKEASQE